ncbi:hypothetical protein [Dyella sp. 333MFSha]|uniref:hypothetical protein n=1 Tax=Dyella sp. 333MFSha TaxID=1798240 RepID=UPI0008856B66|nr:hypothetical protein [Dyella sp. 333MFSha]SDG08753.1 hypothetical protein SAMN04515659_2083 [Dyella sp. 333MFSha]
MHRHLIVSLGAGVAALVVVHARAAPVVIESVGLDKGNVTAQLERSSQYFVNAMRKLIVQSYREQYRAIRWEGLEETMTRSRVARFEYRFTLNGVEQVRVYHAMDGLPLSVIADDAFGGTTPRGSPTPPQSPGSLDGSSGSDIEETSATETFGAASDLVDADIADDLLFDEFDSMNVRARVLPSSGSVLASYTAPGAQGGLDAEFKAMRTIENDIRAGVIPRGGRIRGAIGGATCGSCEDAMRRLSDEYGVEVRVSHMFGSIPSGEQRALIESGSARLKGRMLVGSEGEPLLARDVLDSARAAQIRRDLSPRALDRTFKGFSWRRRSFRLGPPRLPRVSEGSSTEDTAVSAEPSAAPGC